MSRIPLLPDWFTFSDVLHLAVLWVPCSLAFALALGWAYTVSHREDV